MRDKRRASVAGTAAELPPSTRRRKRGKRRRTENPRRTLSPVLERDGQSLRRLEQMVAARRLFDRRAEEAATALPPIGTTKQQLIRSRSFPNRATTTTVTPLSVAAPRQRRMSHPATTTAQELSRAPSFAALRREKAQLGRHPSRPLVSANTSRSDDEEEVRRRQIVAARGWRRLKGAVHSTSAFRPTTRRKTTTRQKSLSTGLVADAAAPAPAEPAQLRRAGSMPARSQLMRSAPRQLQRRGSAAAATGNRRRDRAPAAPSLRRARVTKPEHYQWFGRDAAEFRPRHEQEWAVTKVDRRGGGLFGDY